MMFKLKVTRKHRALISSILISVFITGCSIPGSHISTSNIEVINASSGAESHNINIYPLTAKNISRYKPSPTVSQTNPALDAEIERYEYRVGIGDILNITIWDHPELTIPAGSYRSSEEAGNWVHTDGSIFYPYIGLVKVEGKTVTQIRETLTNKLKNFIESPQVDVNVASFRSQKAYITGEINRPGQQPITNVPLTVLDAINSAGGLTESADWKQVSLTRNGEEQSLSLYGLIHRGDLTQNRLLLPGDIVHVPRNDNQKVFVMGEVRNPQLLTIDRSGMSLTEALSNVGGINELSADATGVFVIRGDQAPDTMANVFQLDIKDATALVLGTEFTLEPNDIVYVTASPISRWNRVVAQLIPTISGFNNLTEGALRVRTWP